MRAVLLLGTLLLLAGCGGGGGGRVQLPPSPPPAPTLSVTSSIKQLSFSWQPVAGATSYRLLENPDGKSGFTQIGDALPASATGTSVVVAVHDLDWVNALYRLEACTADLCTGSTSLGVAAAMLDAIGYFKASNTEKGDQFGISMALSRDGRTLAVGAWAEGSASPDDQHSNGSIDSGAVYVFVRSAAGAQWSQQAYLKAPNLDSNDFFGTAVALNALGDTLAVGALGEASAAAGIDGSMTDNTAPLAGATYIFVRDAGGQWSFQAYVKASNPELLDQFGRAVALDSSGNRLAVVATGEASSAVGVNGSQTNNTAPRSGAVYIYSRIGTQWSQEAYLKASNTNAEDIFGSALALSADGATLAVSAVGEDSNAVGIGGAQSNNTASASGAVYVFVRAGAQWSQQAYIKASNTETFDEFGASLAISSDGNTLAVGADGEDSNADDSGAVYVFARAAEQWAQQALIKATNADRGDGFGSSVALDSAGDTLAVSALEEQSDAVGVGGSQTSNDAAQGTGAVYVFERSGTQWSPHAYVKQSNTPSGGLAHTDQFGFRVALDGEGKTLAASAPREDSAAIGIDADQLDATADEAGAVYIY